MPALSGFALAAAVLLNASTAAVAAPAEPFQKLVPFDQATIIDRNSVTEAVGGLLTADGTNLCAINPYEIAYSDGTYPCFADSGNFGTPGIPYAPDPPRLVPFDRATVIDPTNVRIVPGGVIAADGTDLCTDNPGSIVFPDGRYPCFINFGKTHGADPIPEDGGNETPQVGELPVGGVDTGVQSPAHRGTSTLSGAGLLGMVVIAIGTAIGMQARSRH
ncbi:hypothetical protein [Arthrobacter sp. Ld5]|uniref:hypothetical protein n=1 Tax=Arthrobacter sp. Ld5 TaxID=649152 RepID=UPI003EB6E1EC